MKFFLPATVIASTLLANGSPAQDTPTPVTTAPWQEAVVSVTDLDVAARFFREIGGYEIKWRGALDAAEIESWALPSGAGGEALLLGPRWPGQRPGSAGPL